MEDGRDTYGTDWEVFNKEFGFHPVSVESHDRLLIKVTTT